MNKKKKEGQQLQRKGKTLLSGGDIFLCSAGKKKARRSRPEDRPREEKGSFAPIHMNKKKCQNSSNLGREKKVSR